MFLFASYILLLIFLNILEIHRYPSEYLTYASGSLRKNRLLYKVKLNNFRLAFEKDNFQIPLIPIQSRRLSHVIYPEEKMWCIHLTFLGYTLAKNCLIWGDVDRIVEENRVGCRAGLFHISMVERTIKLLSYLAWKPVNGYLPIFSFRFSLNHFRSWNVNRGSVF